MHRKIRIFSQAVGKKNLKPGIVDLALSVCNFRVFHAAPSGICSNLWLVFVCFNCAYFSWSPMCVFSAIVGVRWKSGVRPAPLLSAAPLRALIDEQISIQGNFLPPHSPVTLYAQMRCEDNDLWESFAHYNSDAHGTVNCELYRILFQMMLPTSNYICCLFKYWSNSCAQESQWVRNSHNRTGSS